MNVEESHSAPPNSMTFRLVGILFYFHSITSRSVFSVEKSILCSCRRCCLEIVEFYDVSRQTSARCYHGVPKAHVLCGSCAAGCGLRHAKWNKFDGISQNWAFLHGRRRQSGFNELYLTDACTQQSRMKFTTGMERCLFFCRKTIRGGCLSGGCFKIYYTE